MSSFAVIFDMDGVIVHTNPFHKEAWQVFCQTHGLEIDQAEFERKSYGRINADILVMLFGPDLPPDRIEAMGREKEALFRELAAGKLPPLAGLEDLLTALDHMNVTRAVATSAPPENVDFVMAETGLARFFPIIIDETHVRRGKPAPDIYQAAARKLNMPAHRCLVFEDSLAGIQSGRNAGMTVVGLSTTHPSRELAPDTVMVLPDFREVGSVSGVERLRKLVFSESA